MRLAYKFYSEGYDYEKGITITSAVIVDPINIYMCIVIEGILRIFIRV